MGRLPTNSKEYLEYLAKQKWLNRYNEAVAQVEFFQEQLAELESASTRTTARLDGMPGGGRDTTRLARGVERIDEAKKNMEEELDHCVKYRLEIVAELAKLQHDQAQEVLLRKYIAGESYHEIGKAMGLVDRRVYQLHRYGVKHVLKNGAKGVQ